MKFRFMEVLGRLYFSTRYFFIVFYYNKFYSSFSGYDPCEFSLLTLASNTVASIYEKLFA